MKRPVTVALALGAVMALMAEPAAAGLFTHDNFEYDSTSALKDIASPGGFGWTTNWRDKGGANPMRLMGVGGYTWLDPDGAKVATRYGATARNSASRTLDLTQWDLTGDNSTLWMGLLYGGNTAGQISAAVFAEDDLIAAANTPGMPVGKKAVGFMVNVSSLSSFYLNGTATTPSGTLNVGTSAGVLGFLAMKIQWGTADTGDGSMHTITVWKLDAGQVAAGTEPTTGGQTVSGLNFDQSNFQVFSFQDNKAAARFDEIRFAPTLGDLVGEDVPVPEPATVVLLALGGLGVLLKRRRNG